MPSKKRKATKADEGGQDPAFKDALFLSVQELFTTSKYSDLTVICENREWHVHKAIVCSKSEVFAKMCDIGMKESNANVITLEEDDSAAVDAMLYYMYNAAYNEEMQSEPVPMVLNVAVYVAADKYNLPGLTKLAATKFSERAYAEWETKCGDFAAAIKDIYAAGADREHELRDCIMEICSMNAKALFEDEAFDKFREVVQTVTGFSAELCTKLASLVPAPKLDSSASGHRCFLCGHSTFWPNIDPNAWYTCPKCTRAGAGTMWMWSA